MMMYISAFLAFVAILFCGVVMISSDKHQDVIEDLYWSHGSQTGCTASCADAYTGIYSIVVKATDGTGDYTTTVDWDSNQCTSSFCEVCDNALKTCISFTVLCAVCCIPSLFTNFFRATGSGNSEYSRYVGATSSLAAMICALIAVIVFATTCQQEIDDSSNDDTFSDPSTAGDFEWEYGVAWVLMLIVAILKFTDMIINLAVTVHDVNEPPFHGGDPVQNTEPLNPSSTEPGVHNGEPAAGHNKDPMVHLFADPEANKNGEQPVHNNNGTETAGHNTGTEPNGRTRS